MNEKRKTQQRIPMIQKLATRDSTLTKGGLLTNCYTEITPIAKRVVKRPGYEELGRVGDACIGQGAAFFQNKTVFIGCDTIHIQNYGVLFARVSTLQSPSDPNNHNSGTMLPMPTTPTYPYRLIGAATDPTAGLPIAADYIGGGNLQYLSPLLTTFGAYQIRGIASSPSGYCVYSVTDPLLLFFDKSWNLITSFVPPTIGGDVCYNSGSYYVCADTSVFRFDLYGNLLNTATVPQYAVGINSDGTEVCVLSAKTATSFGQVTFFSMSLSFNSSFALADSGGAFSGAVGIAISPNYIFTYEHLFTGSNEFYLRQYSRVGTLVNQVAQAIQVGFPEYVGGFVWVNIVDTAGHPVTYTLAQYTETLGFVSSVSINGAWVDTDQGHVNIHADYY